MPWTALGSLPVQVPIDWIIIGVVVLAITFDAFRAGTNRACALVIALPSALVLFSALPKTLFLASVSGQASSPSLNAGLFGVLFVAVYLLVHRIIGFYGGGGGGPGPLYAALTGIAATIVLLAVWIQLPELQFIWHFGPPVERMFAEAYRFWWILGSYAALAFVRS